MSLSRLHRRRRPERREEPEVLRWLDHEQVMVLTAIFAARGDYEAARAVWIKGGLAVAEGAVLSTHPAYPRIQAELEKLGNRSGDS